MNLETVFDDLEAQLACSANSRITSLQKLFEVRRVRLHFGGEQQFSLIAPILGDDFVAGFEEQTGNWMLAAHAHLARIDFDHADDHELPKLRRQSATLSDFLKSMPMPAAASLGLTDGRSQGAVLLEATAKWLFVQPASEAVATAHSLESLRFICLLEAIDRSELQEWSAR
jgi:hypothetical protein